MIGSSHRSVNNVLITAKVAVVFYWFSTLIPALQQTEIIEETNKWEQEITLDMIPSEMDINKQNWNDDCIHSRRTGPFTKTSLSQFERHFRYTKYGMIVRIRNNFVTYWIGETKKSASFLFCMEIFNWDRSMNVSYSNSLKFIFVLSSKSAFGRNVIMDQIEMEVTWRYTHTEASARIQCNRHICMAFQSVNLHPSTNHGAAT